MSILKQIDLLARGLSDDGHLLRVIFRKNTSGERMLKLIPFPSSPAIYRDIGNKRILQDGIRLTESNSSDVIISGNKSSLAEITYHEDGAVLWKFPEYNGLRRSPDGSNPFRGMVPLKEVDTPFCFGFGHCDKISFVRNNLTLYPDTVKFKLKSESFVFLILLMSTRHERHLPSEFITRELGENLSMGFLFQSHPPNSFVQRTPVGAIIEPAGFQIHEKPNYWDIAPEA